MNNHQGSIQNKNKNWLVQWCCRKPYKKIYFTHTNYFFNFKKHIFLPISCPNKKNHFWVSRNFRGENEYVLWFLINNLFQLNFNISFQNEFNYKYI
jgi:hypothetical protein